MEELAYCWAFIQFSKVPKTLTTTPLKNAGQADTKEHQGKKNIFFARGVPRARVRPCVSVVLKKLLWHGRVNSAGLDDILLSLFRGRRRDPIVKKTLLKKECHVDQPDHHRHFHQRPDDGCKGLAGGNPEDRHGHGDGQLEVIAGCREGERGRLLVVRADRLAHQEADQEHDHEVDQQRDGDPHHVQR